uniref:Uncharacterized protein n=1 Tax=Cacopsylla melanoneura TaxID=428564 RepID=A0A8D8UBT4_9HEMI
MWFSCIMFGIKNTQHSILYNLHLSNFNFDPMATEIWRVEGVRKRGRFLKGFFGHKKSPVAFFVLFNIISDIFFCEKPNFTTINTPRLTVQKLWVRVFPGSEKIS